MKSINHLLAVFLFFFLHTSLAAQEQSAVADLSVYASRIDTFSRYYPHEKVYLHFDNTSYFLGDTIWFKAYLVDAVRHLPDNWSRTLYVELLTQGGEIITTKKYKTTDGQCHGFLALKDTLWSGYYEVRAYTRWMLNFGSGHEFSRVFPVFDKPKDEGDYRRVIRPRDFRIPNFRRDDPWKWERKGARVTMDFFPEGGHLVKGIPGRIAFKVLARDSGYIDMKGQVYDQKGRQVSYFSTVHDGMGFFDLLPGDEKYTAEINVDGKSWKFPLPAVEQEGCTFRADVFDPLKIRLSIYRSNLYRNQPLGITVMCRGRVYISAELPASGREASVFSISRDELPTGVNQITLFNASGEVLAERLVFIDHKDGLRMKVEQEKATYRPFEQIGLDVSIHDKDNSPVETTFSLAVRDGENSFKENGSDILTYLLLASEIRGYVHNPEYYFKENDREHQNALDLLMMTQGWSRYVWKRLAGIERFKIQHPAEESVCIDGVVRTYSRTFKPVGEADLLMWMMGNGESFKQKGRTDENGNFVFAFDFWGTYTLSLQVKKDGKRKNCDIRLNRFRTPPLRKLSLYESQLPSEELMNQPDMVAIDTATTFSSVNRLDTIKLKDIYKEIDLKEVKVKRKRSMRMEDEGIKNASVVYEIAPILDKLKDFGEDRSIMTLSDLLAQINPYYYMDYGRGDFYKGRPAFWVVDNVDSKESAVSRLTLDKIKLVTINETPGAACYYTDCSDPQRMHWVVIHIYLDNKSRETPSGIRKTQIDGYSLVKEFYNPRYDRKILPNETDYRRTLYWNPNVRTDSLGQARVTFYNNGTCKRMNVSAQTVTSDGRIGTAVQ